LHTLGDITVLHLAETSHLENFTKRTLLSTMFLRVVNCTFLLVTKKHGMYQIQLWMDNNEQNCSRTKNSRIWSHSVSNKPLKLDHKTVLTAKQ
jgi:hypothetical protein